MRTNNADQEAAILPPTKLNRICNASNIQTTKTTSRKRHQQTQATFHKTPQRRQIGIDQQVTSQIVNKIKTR